jgi:hypothetical protein
MGMWWSSLLACASDPAGAAPAEPVAEAPVEAPAPPAPRPATVASAFPVPEGAVRVPTDEFGAWLLDRPVRGPDVPVLTHDGREVGHRARVVDLPVVPGDLQQCADSAIRLRAEWQREQGQEPVFHATSGDPIPWARWAAGERPYEKDNRLAWRSGGPKDWDGYLSAVFMWAGTRSLAYDTVAAESPRGGDLLVAPGSPGHAIVLLDVVQKGEVTLVLVGEGYMPAQDFHVELGPIDGWWAWDAGVTLPHWDLPAEGLRRWK